MSQSRLQNRTQIRTSLIITSVISMLRIMKNISLGNKLNGANTDYYKPARKGLY